MALDTWQYISVFKCACEKLKVSSCCELSGTCACHVVCKYLRARKMYVFDPDEKQRFFFFFSVLIDSWQCDLWPYTLYKDVCK